MKPFLSYSFIVFAALNGLFWVFRDTLAQSWHMPALSLRLGNVLLFAVTIMAFLLESKGLRAKTAAAFVRYVYLGLFLKLLICIAGVMACLVLYREGITLQILIAWMLLYALYTVIEIFYLLKASKALR